MSVILLPVGIYLVNIIKRIEKTDYYDWQVSYNPLRVFGDSSAGKNIYQQ